MAQKRRWLSKMRSAWGNLRVVSGILPASTGDLAPIDPPAICSEGYHNLPRELLKTCFNRLQRAIGPKLIIVLLVFAAALCLGTLIYVQHENQRIINRDMQTAVTLSEIAARFDHEDGNLYRLMVDEAASHHSAMLLEQVGSIQQRIHRISADLKAERYLMSERDKARAALVIAEINKYNEAVGVVSSMLELDFATSAAMLRPFRQNADRVLVEVREIASTGIADAHRHAALAAARTRLLVAAVVVAVLIVAVLSYLWLALASRRGIQLGREMKRRSDAEREALLLARTDALTGLINRRAFNAELGSAIKQASEDHTEFAVLLLDLDDFKEANDVHGHAAGDAVLVSAADRLRTVFNDGDEIARLGGDEFAVLVHSYDDVNTILSLATAAGALLQMPTGWEGNAIRVGASIGIARFPVDGTVADALLHAADIAMYEAKNRKKGGVRLFLPAMEADRVERRQLEVEMRIGLDAAEFLPFYQPIVRLSDGRLDGYEVLARWQHPRLGILPPAAFLKMAEETGQITNLTRHLLRQTCRDLRNMADGLRFAVNISPVQLGETGLVETILDIVHEEGVDPSRLEIEITEDAVMDDLASAERAIDAFRTSGMTIALDDFGTGYSSLSNLQRLKFDKLKIDQSFVKDLDRRPESRKLVEAIIGMALSLGMNTTAEGIEDEGAAVLLASLGCTQGQGFYFGHSAPAGDLPAKRGQISSWAA